jgi:NAD-dependent deacetylase sirtuin 5
MVSIYAAYAYDNILIRCDVGLSQRAGHQSDKLHLLHGSLFDVKCNDFFCQHFESNNFTDPIVPALATPIDETDYTTNEARAIKELDLADMNVHLPEIALHDLPHCPKCNALLRPGVVWFGESLPGTVLQVVDDFISSSSKIDLIMVIGTSASVFPAAGYIQAAQDKGARVAVFNVDGDLPAHGLGENDWMFQGDAAVLLPELLKPLIGQLQDS